jgi:hypothetical protein
MARHFFPAGVLVAGLVVSACAPYTLPYGRGFRSPIVQPPLMRAVDPFDNPRGRWDNVMRLLPGSVVDVLTVDGAAHVGKISRTNALTVWVFVAGIEEQIPRADVVRVDLVDLPGSEAAAVATRAAGGAALGIGAAALLGGVIGGSAWPPPAALLRAGAAMGGVAGAEAGLVSRRSRLIYLTEK